MPKPIESGRVETARVPNPVKDDLRRKLQLDAQARRSPSEYIRLPQGEIHRITNPGVLPSYPGENTGGMLSDPAGILKEPKPKFLFETQVGTQESDRYRWFVRVPVFTMDIRPAELERWRSAQMVRFIERSEINPRSPDAKVQYLGDGSTAYVTYGSLILVEIIDPDLSWQVHIGWENYCQGRSRNMEEAVRAAKGEAGPTVVPGKTEIKVKLTDVRQGG